MAYLPRSLDAISQSVRGLYRQYMPGTDASLKENVTHVLGKVQALMGRDYELRLKVLARQMFLRTADEAHAIAHCADYRIYRKAAAAASGSIDVTGLANETYPQGLRFVTGNLTFATIAPFTTDGTGAASVAVLAEATGAQGNLAAGTVLNLLDPQTAPTLTQTVAVGVSGFGGGADLESIESLKARGLARKAQPPNGGALHDYENWAMEVPGVVKAWAIPFANGLNTIAVLFLFEGRTNLIPTQADVDAVNAYLLPRQMVRMDPVAAAPVAEPVNVEIADLVGDTPETRVLIDAALAQLYLDRGVPGTDADPFTLSRSWIGEAISQVVGEDSHRLILPADDLTLTGGKVPVPGTVTYS